MHGKGIKLVLMTVDCQQTWRNPNLYIIHDDDLLRVINAAVCMPQSAEVIAINGERIVASEIRCAGPISSVNNNRSAPPYEIKA